MKFGFVILIVTITFSCKKETRSPGWTIYTDSNGLSSNTVSSIAIDSQNNKWFGTTTGVSKFDGKNWFNYGLSNGLADTYILSIAIDKQRNK